MFQVVVKGVVTTVAMAAAAFGQNAAEEVSLRVLTLGNRAPFVQEVRGGMRQEVDPPEGSLPPRKVSVGIVSPDPEVEATDDKSLTLRLGEVSTPLKFKNPESPVVRLRDDDAGRLWLKQGLSKAKATMLIVWRVGKTWEETRSLAIDDSTSALPAGACRVVNVAPVEVKMIWGAQRYRLPSGKSVVLKIPDSSASVPLQIFYTDSSKKLKPCLSTTVEKSSSSRRQWFVYRADRSDARTPIQVLPYSEAG